jgi:hypothetical protein
VVVADVDFVVVTRVMVQVTLSAFIEIIQAAVTDLGGIPFDDYGVAEIAEV